MGRLPPPARGYLLLLFAWAALMLLRGNPISNPPERDLLLVSLVLGVGLIVADVHLLELSHTTKLSVSTALEFALLLIAGPALATWTIAISVGLTAVWHLRHAWRWYNVAFYAANGVISIGLAGAVYQQLASGIPLLGSAISVAGVTLAATTYFVLNVGTVALMVALARNSDSVVNFFSAFQVAAPQFAGLLALGVVCAAVYSASPMAAVLLVIPLLGVYASLHSALTLRVETKRAIEALAMEVDRYHPYTSKHSERVAYYTCKIAKRMQLSEEQVEALGRAARIHDLGKLTIWPGMLNKPSGLTEEELQELRTHPARGAKLVDRFPDYRNGRDMILHHHERYDGEGYPDRLKGEAIPLGARIIGVADACDAMLSDRPYRKAMTATETMKELERNRARQFDPALVDVMLGILREEAVSTAWEGLSPVPATV